MTQHERRLEQRHFLQIEAKLSTDADSFGSKVVEELTTTNISSGGAFLSTSREIPLASKVYLEFLLDYEQLKKLRFILSLDSLKNASGGKIWVKATGVVIRREENGIGIIFDEYYQLTPMDGQAAE